MNLKKLVLGFPPVVLAVLISYFFLDGRIALFVMALLKSVIFLQTITADIPDALFLLVCFCSGFLWSRYLVHRHRGIKNEQSLFYLLAGCSVPLAYLLKWLLKPVFGRTNTRAWLTNQMSDGFHWFQGSALCSSFPSGHMTVFTAFFAAVWLIYPRYRSISIGLLLLLALALVATNYHFLSDVIAGAYLGLVATYLTGTCLNKIGVS